MQAGPFRDLLGRLLDLRDLALSGSLRGLRARRAAPGRVTAHPGGFQRLTRAELEMQATDLPGGDIIARCLGSQLQHGAGRTAGGIHGHPTVGHPGDEQRPPDRPSVHIDERRLSAPAGRNSESRRPDQCDPGTGSAGRCPAAPDRRNPGSFLRPCRRGHLNPLAYRFTSKLPPLRRKLQGSLAGAYSRLPKHAAAPRSASAAAGAASTTP